MRVCHVAELRGESVDVREERRRFTPVEKTPLLPHSTLFGARAMPLLSEKKKCESAFSRRTEPNVPVSKFRRTTPFWNMPTTCRRATQAKKQKTAKAQSNTILKRPHAADYRLIPARDGGVVSLHLSCTIASTASPLPSAGPRARRRRRGLRGHLAQARLIVSLSRAPKDATFD